MALEKIKIMGAVLELTANQHCQFSPLCPYLTGWIGNAVQLVAPKRPPEFQLFQLPWVLIIHLSLIPLKSKPTHFLDILIYLQVVWLHNYCPKVTFLACLLPLLFQSSFSSKITIFSGYAHYIYGTLFIISLISLLGISIE